MSKSCGQNTYIDFNIKSGSTCTDVWAQMVKVWLEISHESAGW